MSILIRPANGLYHVILNGLPVWVAETFEDALNYLWSKHA